jgi:signal peptidase I
MNEDLKDQFWKAFWYFILPAGLAIATLQGAWALRALAEPPAPWQYLLAFAVLEMIVLTVRDKVMAYQGVLKPFNALQSDGRELQDEARKLLKKSKASDEVKTAVEEGITAVEEAIKGKKPKELDEALRELDGRIEKHLGAARKGTTREYVEAIAFAVLVALGVRAFVVEAFKIPSPSMYPTLNVGDNIFVNKFVYGPLIPFTNKRLFNGRIPERGEIVVFVYPQDPSKDFIKRVIGLPGDRIRVHPDGVIEVNGRPLSRCQVGYWSGDNGDGRPPGSAGEEQRLNIEWHGNFSYFTLRARENFADPPPRNFGLSEEYTVPAGHVFVMGDNRDNSYDSRFWGAVPMQNIKGRALWIWWSNLPGAGCGMRWNRFGHDLMAAPTPPPGLESGFNACVRRGREGSVPSVAREGATAPTPIPEPTPAAAPSADPTPLPATDH